MASLKVHFFIRVHREPGNFKLVQARPEHFNRRTTGAWTWLNRHQIKYAVGVGAFGDIDHRRIDMDLLQHNFSAQQLPRLKLNHDLINPEQLSGLARPRGRKHLQ